jgi:hypothetical protein
MRNLSTVALTVMSLFLAAQERAAAETIYGIAAGQFIPEFVFSFDSATPGTVLTKHDLTGLMNNDFIGAIDIRPSTGALYGLGLGSENIYRIDPSTGGATFVSRMSSTPPGFMSSIDFDPVTDRLRVIASSGSNLLVNVETGQAIEQGTLAWAPDAQQSGTPVIYDIAYSNNIAGANATTLYAYEPGRGIIATIAPPESGTLHTLSCCFTGSRGGDGFDISGLSGSAYIWTYPAGFYTVDLQTASVMASGGIGINPNELMYDIAAPVGAEIPEPGTIVLLSIGFAAMAVVPKRLR